jgi:hypothetical protein
MAGWERMKVRPARSVLHLTFSRSRLDGAGADGGREGGGGGEGAGRGGREGEAGVERVEKAADGRPGDRRRLVDGLVPGDGVAEALARHEVRHERVAGRVAEGARGAGQGGEGIDRRHRLDAEPGAQEQAGGGQAAGRVRQRRHEPPVVGVGDVAGDEGEGEGGREGEQPGEAEGPGAPRHVVDEQPDGHGLRLPPQDG